MAAIASFPAREVIVGTMGLIYDVGEVDTKDEEKTAGLKQAVRKEWEGDPVRGKYAVAVALSVMVFMALCLQCVSTLAVTRRETRSWAWPAFTFAYMTTLAYLGALVTFQVGRLITDAV
jgi:ferrous iron transport protein B